jgi:hypothetical protein
MAVRSVSELLPRSFEDLTEDDIRRIVENVGSDRESLYFERKLKVTPDSLAKSCSAFANTFGGLLLIGVDDKTDELVGVDEVSEPQVWVKDVLRGNVIPLPPFRARWARLGGGEKGMLLVLLEESSTTPHLLTRNGAIYVRNPASSDPVPVGDQGRLLELTRRGTEAREGASRAADQTASNRFHDFPLYTLAMAPTGLTHDAVRAVYEDSSGVVLLRRSTEFEDMSAETSTQINFTEPEWSLHSVELMRTVDRPFPLQPQSFMDVVRVESDGALQLQRCLLPGFGGENPEPRGPRPMDMTERFGIVPWFSAALKAGRDLLLELGAHGDLRIVFELDAGGRWIMFSSTRSIEAKRNSYTFKFWARVDAVPSDDDVLMTQFEHDFRRDLGLART